MVSRLSYVCDYTVSIRFEILEKSVRFRLNVKPVNSLSSASFLTQPIIVRPKSGTSLSYSLALHENKSTDETIHMHMLIH